MKATTIFNWFGKEKTFNNNYCMVYCADTMPDTPPTLPAVYVTNTSKAGQAGSHWVLFYFDKEGNAYFIDPLGMAPEVYSRHFIKVLNLTTKAYNMYTDMNVQSLNSKLCGGFVLYIAYYICKGVNPEKVMDSFCSMSEMNDVIIEAFLTVNDLL